ncbi:MAG: hypothetical protein EOM51_04660 [Clostridia bacterium]|nr:hypothetical protein [Clostridia bacterium]
MNIKDALDTISPDPNLILRTELLLMAKANKRKVKFYKSLAVAASLLFIISIMSVGGYAYYQHPVNYIDVDINPSLELEVNAFNRVIDVTYFNSDAEKLIESDDLTGCKTETAVALILQAASDSGYIIKDETSVVSLAAYGRNAEKTQDLLSRCTNTIQNQYCELAVYTATVSDELKSEAKATSISAGKLGLIKMIQTLDSTATTEYYRNKSVASIVNQLTCLCSEVNTGVSEETKANIQNRISGVNAQIECIEQNRRSQEMQGAGSPNQFNSSAEYGDTYSSSSVPGNQTDSGQFGGNADDPSNYCQPPATDSNNSTAYSGGSNQEIQSSANGKTNTAMSPN